MNRVAPCMNGGAARILIVDDDLRDAELLARTLKAAGFSIFIASTGEAALKILERHTCDLVVLDVHLPGIDGREVARQARSLQGHGATPLFFLSGFSEPHDVLAAFQAGACDFVAKPFVPEQLVARVRAQVRETSA